LNLQFNTVTGARLRKTVSTQKTTAGSVTDYCGNFIYADNQLITIFAGDVRVVPVNVGNSTYWKYEYSMKDHTSTHFGLLRLSSVQAAQCQSLSTSLGNVRVVFAAHSHGQPELLQQTSYYPFGMTMQQQNFYSQNATENKYLYNSKELQDDQLAGNTLEWYDYGARFYDATLGRWHVVDPLAEDYSSWSPYNYVMNNPLKFIDPDGMRVDEYEFDAMNWPHKQSDIVINKI
jgi:RHS repeat-associated protein